MRKTLPTLSFPTIVMGEAITNLEDNAAGEWTDQASTVMNVRGMNCAGSVAALERVLRKVEGVRTARASEVTHSAEVIHAASLATEQLLAAAKSAGFAAEIAHSGSFQKPFCDFADASQAWFRRTVVGGTVLVICLLCRFIWWMGVSPLPKTPVALFCAVVIYGYVGAPFYRNAVVRLRHLSANIDTLVALGVTVLFCYGIFASWYGLMPIWTFLEGIAILTVVSFGRMMETRARAKASGSIRGLMMMASETAKVVNNDDVRTVRLADVKVDQHVVVAPGERVPLDGEVVSGTSTVNESWLTGAAVAVTKQAGDKVVAASTNVAASLTVRVTHTADRSTLARVVDLVRRIDSPKSRRQRVGDFAATWLLPIVLLVALLGGFYWGFVIGDVERGVRAAVSVIVVSCPCSCGLVSPLAIMVARQRGAKHGILIKNAEALEIAGKVSSLLVDKASTGTTVAASVVRVLSTVGGEATDEWLRMAAAAERTNNHPLARAIVARAHQDGLRNSPVQAARTIPGEGVAAVCEGQQVLVGNQKLLARFNVEPFGVPSVVNSDPRSCVAVAVGGRHVGNIFVDYGIDPVLRNAIKRLRRLNLATTIVSNGKDVGEQRLPDVIQADGARSLATPPDKLALVERLQKLGHVVGMIGHGMQDAPALTAANLGIAVGKGADIAAESADVVIVNDDLQNLVRIVQLARATRRVMQRNLWWALGYHLLLIPLAAGVFYPLTGYLPFAWVFGGFMLAPWVAASLMALTNVSVVTSCLSLNHCSLE